jgi:hypothetical protein
VTKSSDDKAWNEFVSWCGARGLSAMPANPWTLAAYARWCEREQRYPAIAKNIRAIARVHNSKSRKRPDRHPTVTQTLHLIETRGRAKKKVKDAPKALFPEDDVLATGKAKKTGKAANTAKAGKAGKKGGKGKPRRPGLSAGPKLVSRRRLKK